MRQKWKEHLAKVLNIPDSEQVADASSNAYGEEMVEEIPSGPITKGAFFWDYSGYSCSDLGMAQYKEFQFPKEHSFILKTE